MPLGNRVNKFQECRIHRSLGILDSSDLRYSRTKQLNLSTLRLRDLSEFTRQIVHKGWGPCEAADEDDFLALRSVNRRCWGILPPRDIIYLYGQILGSGECKLLNHEVSDGRQARHEYSVDVVSIYVLADLFPGLR